MNDLAQSGRFLHDRIVDTLQRNAQEIKCLDESRDSEELRSVFFHLNAQKAVAYRIILRVFVAAKEGFEIALRPAEILGRIGEAERRHVGLGNEDEIIACLDQLCVWGNLDATRDMVSARSIEEYLHPKRLFQLTHAGDIAEQALAFFDNELMRPGELSATALREIAEALEHLLRLMASEELDAAKAVKSLKDLSSRFDELVTRAQMFIGGLQREMDKPVGEESAFIALKEELLGYLDRFVKELTSSSYRIRSSLEKLDAKGMESSLEAAAHAELADELAPTESRKAQTLRRWQHHWSGLRGWFISSGHHTAHAESLRSRATAAIPALLERVRRMHDQRANRADRSTDFLALARWFAQAPSDEDMHGLWRSAFALNSCRHLRVNETTLQAWAAMDDDERPSWEDFPPYIITIAQWTRGRVAARGRPPGIIDRAAARAALRERAEAESQSLHQARSVLAARTPCALSELPELDEAGFEVLLDAIGEAFAMIGPADQQGEAVTADGGMSVQIHLPVSRAELARLNTAEGVLSGPDLRITLRLTEEAAT